MEQTLTTSVANKTERRREAFNELITELHVARKVAITPDRLSGLLKKLHADNYTYGQFQRAKVWILYGDWTRKGFDPTLELSDFYPTEDQFRESRDKIKNEGILMFTKEQFKREYERIKLIGYSEGIARKELENVCASDLKRTTPLKNTVESALVELFGAKVK